MIDFLSYRVDRTSFWVGFLAGALFFWFILQVRNLAPRFWRYLRKQIQAARESLTIGTENRLRQDVYQWAQRQHLASSFFSLQEILIEPRLMAPPVQMDAPEEAAHYDITQVTLPYMPDWPEMGAIYGWPTLSIAEAMQGGANLLLIGQSGSGKTVALANIASRIASRDPEAGDLATLFPLFLHSATILPRIDSRESADVLISALSDSYASTITLPRLPGLLRNLLQSGRVLLLLDGVDELNPDEVNQIRQFLALLLATYPSIRLVVAASPVNYCGLNQLGLIPVALAAWNNQDRKTFIQQWGQQWSQFIEPELKAESDIVDAMLIKNWLFVRDAAITPLEMTLKTWAAYSGDILGPDLPSQIEAYLQRMTFNEPNTRRALENLAFQMLNNSRLVISYHEAEKMVSEYGVVSQIRPEEAPSEENLPPSKGKKASGKVPPWVHFLSNLNQIGLLVSESGAHVHFCHPIIASYLAGLMYADSGDFTVLMDQPDWSGKYATLGFAGHFCDISPVVSRLIENGKRDPLHSGELRIARWLRYANKNSTWRQDLLKQLAYLLQKEYDTLGLSARVLSAMTLSGDTNLGGLFRHLLQSAASNLKQLAALGSGLLNDVKAIPDLGLLTEDPSPNVGRAACLALTAIGNRSSLDAVLTVLLHGNEEMRRSAAEALVIHPEEGQPALEEGISMEDLLVRRAVIFGLVRIKRPEITKLLEKMAIEDAQWVVRNAASQALDFLRRPNPYIPKPPPEIINLPWLITFAGKTGIGVFEEVQAKDLILQVLERGDEKERLEALEYLRLRGDENAITRLYHTYYSTGQEIHEAAFNTLWHLAASGINLPSPMQFGLGATY